MFFFSAIATPRSLAAAAAAALSSGFGNSTSAGLALSHSQSHAISADGGPVTPVMGPSDVTAADLGIASGGNEIGRAHV